MPMLRSTLLALIAAAGLAAASPVAAPDWTVSVADAEAGNEPRAAAVSPLPPVETLPPFEPLPAVEPQDADAAEPRGVKKPDPEAFAEAQQVDPTATYAFRGFRIRTGDDRCLVVDRLSGDDRANLTPVQVVECPKKMRRQRWDVVTAGCHIAGAGCMLVVSNSTRACLNVDRRADPGRQVFLFSCCGRADGSGTVTDSQLFAYDAERDAAGPLSLRPENSPGMCLTSGAEVVDIEPCVEGAQNQTFSFEKY